MNLLNKYCNYQSLVRISLNNSVASYANFSSAKTKSNEDAEVESELPVTFIDDEELHDKEARINKLRNKSRLSPPHRNMLNSKVPYDEPQSWIHKTEKYNRMMFGRYGIESGVDPRICFATKEVIEDRKEYEKVAFPRTVQEMIKINARSKREEAAKIKNRDDEIAKKIEKLDQWKNELNAKIAKKEADARAAKDRKDRIVEEVRRHFGFKVDARDEKFQELLEQKEKEDRKQQKEAKRKIKEAKMYEKLVAKTEALPNTSQETENSDIKSN